jgi:stearoyl-CoA desaturase (delta-9 desaturase)
MYFASQNIKCGPKTAIMAIIWGIIGGLSITIGQWNITFLVSHTLITHPANPTAGYHRLWAHRSFQACTALRVLLAVVGAAQNQWSIMWWVKHHRAHHNYTDTDRDPYNAKRGLLFSHIGWLLGYNEAAWGPVDVSDLEDDPVVVWQRLFYYPLLIVVGFLLPAAVAHYGWNDWKGGMLYGGLFRIIISQQITFSINSVSHASWAGTQPYSANTTARNVPFLAILTLGEANHNFHHAFPMDYRNGIEWYEPDISRWIIWVWEKLGLASNLKTARFFDIKRARLCQESGVNQRLDYTKCNIQGFLQLPQISWKQYVSQCNRGHCLVSIGGVVYDVIQFMDGHPGGRDLIQQAIGKDATDLYHQRHVHSGHAEAALQALQVFLIEST